MSSGDPTRRNNISTRHMLSAFAAIGVALYLVYTFAYTSDAFFLQNAPLPAQQTGGSSVTEVDTTAAARVVAEAKVAQAREQAEQVRARLQRLQQKHAAWLARSASLLSGDPGRKIAGSPAHLNLAVELFEREPPSATTLVSWEQELTLLAAPLDVSQQLMELTPEFTQALNDLSRRVLEATAEIDRRLQLAEALTRETVNSPLAERTLEATLQDRKEQAVKAEAERLAAIREQARKEAEEENARRIAALERDLVAAAGKRQEEKLQAEKDRIEQLIQAEQRQAAEEAKLREAQARAVEAGLKAEATKVDMALEEAQLEREFQRDLPAIKSYLSAFISEGYVHRQSGKGPVSLSYLKSSDALSDSETGRRVMQTLAISRNDRPPGAMPTKFYVDALPHLNRASELLRKYGDLLVNKKMLDP